MVIKLQFTSKPCRVYVLAVVVKFIKKKRLLQITQNKVSFLVILSIEMHLD